MPKKTLVKSVCVFCSCPIHCPLVDRSEKCCICLYAMKVNEDQPGSTIAKSLGLDGLFVRTKTDGGVLIFALPFCDDSGTEMTHFVFKLYNIAM